MKERPILFNGPMVRALLEGRNHHIHRPLRFVQKRGVPVELDC